MAWFTHEQFGRVHAIGELKHDEEVFSYLVVGDTGAVLIDTGMGYEDIGAFIAPFVGDKPVTVVLSHAHFDHIGGAPGFKRVLIYDDPWEIAQLEQGFSSTSYDELSQSGMFKCADYRPRPYDIPGRVDARRLRDGQELEIGGVRLQIIHTPGHSPGSICVLLGDDRAIAVADLVYDGPLFAQMPESDPRSYAASLRRIASMRGQFDLLLPGHNYCQAKPELIDRCIGLFDAYETGAAIDGCVKEHSNPNGRLELRVRDQARTPYVDALRSFRAAGRERLIVPGHKGGRQVAPQLRSLIGNEALAHDIPLHISGIDKGPPTPTPIEQALALAADAWGARSTRFIVGGASQANHVICVALGLMCDPGPARIAVQRNVHQSVVYGLALAGADVTWIDIEMDEEYGMQHVMTSEDVDAALRPPAKHVDAVIVVSPTYAGVVSDIPELRKVCDRHGALLFVDEAWGAHFPFSDRFPESAVTAGADLVTVSTHKLLGSLTQTAMLHVARRAPNGIEGHLKAAANLLKTTSPNSLLLASLDAARAYAVGAGGKLLEHAADCADALRVAVREINPGFAVLDSKIVGRPGVAAFDPLRVAVGTRAVRLSAAEIRDALLQVSPPVELEYATEDVFVALFGIGDGVGRADAVLAQALPLALGMVETRDVIHPPYPGKLVQALSLRDAIWAATERVALGEAVGRISAELIAPYPPGIAIVMPGERLDDAVVQHLLSTRSEVSFPDCESSKLGTLKVTVE